MKKRIEKRYLILTPLLVAIVMMCISYWVTNMSWPISGEKTLISKFEYKRQKCHPKQHIADTSVIFINVSHDRQLVPCYGEGRKLLGNSAIVDRGKLLKLLQYLAADSSYRYVILDVLFDTAGHTEADSALFATIATMPRIVIPRDTMPLADARLYQKSGEAFYHTSLIESDFLKYPYYTGRGASMALRVYEDCTGRTIRRWGPLYIDGRCLSRRSVVLTFDVIPQYEVLDLGADMLQDTLWPGGPQGSGVLYDKDLCNIKDKYVVIGSFEGDDIHNTYAGMLPGPVINYNAAMALLKGGHHVSLWVALIMFVLFYAFSFMTINQISIVGQMQRSKYATIRTFGVLLTWVGYPFWLSVFCIFTYVGFNEIYDIMITSTIFSIIDIVTRMVRVLLKKEQ